MIGWPLLLMGAVMAAAAQGDRSDRSVTIGDLRDFRDEIYQRFADMTESLATLTNIVTAIRLDDARDKAIQLQHADHLMALQRKLDAAGIDGTRRLVDQDWCESQHKRNGTATAQGFTTTQAVASGGVLGAIIVALAKGLFTLGTWIAEHMRMK